MGSYWRSKIAIDTFGNVRSKAGAATCTHRSASTMCVSYTAKCHGNPSHSANFTNLYTPISGGSSKRFLFIWLRKNIDSMKPTIPIPIAHERLIGELRFQNLKEGYKGKMLPSNHPKSKRIRLLTQQIIDSLQRGFGIEKQLCNDVRYADHNVKSVHIPPIKQTNLWGFIFKMIWKESAIAHLEGLNWEVLVVDGVDINASCLPGGKIVVFTGLLEHLRSDAEISFVIGHEVGHVVARHCIKRLHQYVQHLTKIQVPHSHEAFTTFSQPISETDETEADSIGLLLLAGAGYDPRIAPKVLEKPIDVKGFTGSTNPFVLLVNKRAELMAQGGMKKALEIYKLTQEGRTVKGFL